MTSPYPVEVLRTLALHTQHLTAPLATQHDTSRDGLQKVVEQVGCIQIDTLQMVHRAQYVTLWSRVGHYDLADFDSLTYQSVAEPNNRRLFEYWYHAACYIPIQHYRFFKWKMAHFAEHHSYVKWMAHAENQAQLAAVREHIGSNGGARTTHFDQAKSQPGGWWNWKPAKMALEYLFDTGELMIANRVNFQRVYDLRERILPSWVDTTEPTYEERMRHFLEEGVRMMGVCLPQQASDYTHNIQRNPARPFVEALMAEGVFVPIEGVLADGRTATLIVHRANLPLLEQIADGAIRAERTTFLTPFDNLFWAQKRDMQFWGFNQTLEAYKRPHDRVWGYFCLPILHRDQLVGRFDVKLERKSNLLRLFALHLEPHQQLTDGMIHDIAAAFRAFMAFHGATHLVIERSQPHEFGKRLLASLMVSN